MENMTLNHIAEACGGKLFGTYDKEVEGVVIDSRKVEKGFLFIATRGERVDGHDFIPDVASKGAAGVVCESAPINCSIPYILVENSLVALKQIAIFYRSVLDIKVVGITGSVGKTSTKEMIAAVLSQKYNVLKTLGNFNNEIGLPLTVLSIRPEHEVAVLEMGISDFGEMHRLSEIARPDVVVITNIGVCHLENLKSREGILKAKSEIFDYLAADGAVCLNHEDDMLRSLLTIRGRKPHFFGYSTENEVCATNIASNGLFGSCCEMQTQQGNFEVQIPLPGDKMVLNAMAATTVGLLLGLTNTQIAAGIGTVKPLSGRCNIIKLDHYTLIDDCYNANPVSVKAALDLLGMADTEKIAILGDMLELGKNEIAMHEEIGKYCGQLKLKRLICIGKLSEYTYQAAKENGVAEVKHFDTTEIFLKEMMRYLDQQDTILIKASHAMNFTAIVEQLKNKGRELH